MSSSSKSSDRRTTLFCCSLNFQGRLERSRSSFLRVSVGEIGTEHFSILFLYLRIINSYYGSIWVHNINPKLGKRQKRQIIAITDTSAVL